MAENFDPNLGDEQESLRINKQINQQIKDRVNDFGDLFELQKDILKNWQDIKKINKSITENQKKINDLLEKAKTASKEEAEILKQQAAAISQENEELKKQSQQLTAINKKLGSKTVLMKGLLNVLKNYAKQGLTSYLDFDQKTRDVAASLGLNNQRMYQMRQEIDGARANILAYGFTLDEVISAQQSYTEELGRSVVLSEQTLENMAKVAKGTGLGVQGMFEMASEMEIFGYNAEKATNTIQNMYENVSALGYPASVFMKKFKEGLPLMNKLNFKNGIKGLEKLVKISTRLKIDMNAIASSAEKLSKLEDAVSAAANLQVLGGELAALGDPFQLMYKARNAPEELAKSISKAASASATFNEKTGEFEVNAYELDRMRHAAEALGMDMNNLVETAKQGAKIGKLEGLIGGGFTSEEKEAIAMMSEITDKGGEINFIDKNGARVVKDLKKLNKDEIKHLLNEKKAADDAAKQATGVKQQYEAIFNNLATMLFPLFEKLMPYVKQFTDWVSTNMTSIFDKIQSAIADFNIKDFMDKAIKFVTTLVTQFREFMDSPIIKTIRDFISKNAGWILGISLLIKYLGPLFSPVAWFARGLQLAKGFNIGTGKGGGGVLSKLFGPKGGGGGVTPGGMSDQSGPISNTSAAASAGVGPMLAFGAAMLMVGAGIAIAAYGLSKLVLAFKDLTGGQIVGALFAITVVMGGFVAMIYAMVPAITALGIAGGAVAIPLLALGAAFLMIGGAIFLAALGVSYLVDSFTKMFSVIGENGSSVLMAGLGFIAMAAGIGVLSMALIALSAASLISLPGFLMLAGVTGLIVSAAYAIESIGSDGIVKTVQAINSVDTTKLEALKELSLIMSLFGGTTKIEFDESLTIDGNIVISGEAGGKTNTDWIKNPVFIKALKDVVEERIDKDSKAGRN
jgi:hypothetical protein